MFRLLALVTTLAGCVRPDAHTLAANADHTFDTRAFTWLVEHEPSGVVAWNTSPGLLRSLLPAATVRAATSERPCAQAAHEHAALLLLARAGEHTRRDYALGCGVILYRDRSAVIVAPLP